MDIIEIIELNASVRAQWADAQFKVERGWIDRDREYKWRVRQCNVRTAHSTERTSIKIFQDCLPNSIACKAIHIFVQCYSWKVKKLIQTRLFTHVIPSIITVPLNWNAPMRVGLIFRLLEFTWNGECLICGIYDLFDETLARWNRSRHRRRCSHSTIKCTNIK